MKKADVTIGGVYRAKVSGRLTNVRIDAQSPHGGWNATNLATRKGVRIKSAQRLRAPAMTSEQAAAIAGADETNAAKGEERATLSDGVTAGDRATSRTRGRPKKDPIEKARQEAIAAIDRNLADADINNGDHDMATKKTRTKKAGTKKTTSKKTRSQKAPRPGASKPSRAIGKLSGLDAAAQILAKAKEPMGCKDLVEQARAEGLWSPGGKTPQATLYAAIIREIAKKRKDARFKKVDRGRFQLAQ